jgi:Zn-dependent protease with chaperone function
MDCPPPPSPVPPHAHTQADAFAASLGHSAKLTEALVSLEKENKSVLNVDGWYSSFHYSHPPLVERMRAIELLGVDLDNKKEK